MYIYCIYTYMYIYIHIYTHIDMYKYVYTFVNQSRWCRPCTDGIGCKTYCYNCTRH